MNLKGEFESSFGSYVPDEGDDIRRQTLVQMLEQVSLEVLISWLEPHDIAALLTCAVRVNPRHPTARKLLREVEQWQRARQQAEDDYEDPDKVSFDQQIDDVPIQFDSSIPGLATFLESVKAVEGGNRYFAQILVCLMWAHRIPEMIPNLWKE